MAKTRQQKEDAVKQLGAELDKKGVVFFHYGGLKVSEMEELRGKLREENAIITVAKRTLLRNVLSEKGLTGGDAITGPVAVASADDEVMPANVSTVYCDPHAVERYATNADLIIGAVLIPGGKAPILIHARHLKEMKNGAVIVDVSVDQGGCIETSHPTTHHEPTFIVDGVVHYCVANMPGAVGRTSSHALCNATFPYCRELASLGIDAFMALDKGRAAAVNMKGGKIINTAVASAFPELVKI